ncbi:DEAD/DEAH box helicase [Candidatus Protofrankia californiensis]|uniref:DEAD/DEAH box helicase n=1 Tax=Candidatus Protofrankia californiensis TaxID=1839754 RepID=UPI0010413FFB|nr:DEAD/DEAH box helicase [Candidatus Protofrankia californiensis]
MNSAFADLDPAVQYHVVNSLRWPALRSLQEAAIRPVLAGHDALLLAPTAGGKTEAAMLPLLSRMAGEGWRGLSVLYVCPLRALLNNLEPRLSAMCGWLGRRAAVWHGDVPDSVKRRLAADPPEVLLTTPESIETMLLSARVDHRWLFVDLRVVVVDEVHAFAGDDRGWHLLGVLARLTRLTGRPIQRVGLSATVGNPDALLDWLANGSTRPRTVVKPADDTSAPSGRAIGAETTAVEAVGAGTTAPEVGLDYVGSVGNAALVIARLHQGEKRLVFCDSRSQAEELTVALRELGVRVHVSHSSLSRDERRQAETAFATSTNCVIVATSTLELGIDVGDLDRVIQIGAPATVASFLQRLGRTGRRAEVRRNTLFLATSQNSLWLAAALTLLWQRGYVEPVIPPALPRHIVAQQILGLILQEGHLVRRDIWEWLGALADIPGAQDVLAHLAASEFVIDSGGLVSIGPRAEAEFGRRFFLDLTSTFTSEPMLQVVWGRGTLGYLPPIALAARPEDGPRVVLLGGRAWKVDHVDWRKKRVWVEPSEHRGRSRWNSDGRAMPHALARAHHDVLAGQTADITISRRAADALDELREKYSFVSDEPGERTYLVRDAAKGPVWWTFAGFAANSALAAGLGELVDPDAAVGDLRVRLRSHVTAADIRKTVDRRSEELVFARPAIDDDAVEGLKFSAAVPGELAQETLAERLADPAAVQASLRATIHDVADGGRDPGAGGDH